MNNSSILNTARGNKEAQEEFKQELPRAQAPGEAASYRAAPVATSAASASALVHRGAGFETDKSIPGRAGAECQPGVTAGPVRSCPGGSSDYPGGGFSYRRRAAAFQKAEGCRNA